MRFHYYKIQLVQALKESDHLLWKSCAGKMLHVFSTQRRLNNVVFSDEAHFYLEGYVNKQNSRYWASTNPKQRHQRQLTRVISPVRTRKNRAETKASREICYFFLNYLVKVKSSQRIRFLFPILCKNVCL